MTAVDEVAFLAESGIVGPVADHKVRLWCCEAHRVDAARAIGNLRQIEYRRGWDDSWRQLHEWFLDSKHYQKGCQHTTLSSCAKCHAFPDEGVEWPEGGDR